MHYADASPKVGTLRVSHGCAGATTAPVLNEILPSAVGSFDKEPAAELEGEVTRTAGRIGTRNVTPDTGGGTRCGCAGTDD